MPKRRRAASAHARDKQYDGPSQLPRLAAQRDLAFSVMAFCTLAELGALHCTCRAWRTALDDMPFVQAGTFEMTMVRAAPLLLSSWACKHVHTLVLDSRRPAPRDALQSVLRLLGRATQLRRLTMCMVHVADVPADVVRTSFASMPKLEELACTRGTSHDFRRVYAHVGELRALTRLDTSGMVPCAKESFAALQLLPCLGELRVMSQDSDSHAHPRLSSAQLRAIFACPSLHTAYVGGVLGDLRPEEDTRRGLISQGVAVVADACAHRASFQQLDLCFHDRVCALVLPLLLRFTRLHTLDMMPRGLTAAHWAQLRALTSLKRVKIRVRRYEPDDNSPPLATMCAAFSSSVEAFHFCVGYYLTGRAAPCVTADDLRALAHTRVTELRLRNARLTREALDGLAALVHLRTLALCNLQAEHRSLHRTWHTRPELARLQTHTCTCTTPCKFTGAF